MLVAAKEYFNLPNSVVGVVHDKSTWGRRGLAVQNTVLEPGWRGYLTIELTNHGTDTITLEDGVGLAQIVFHHMDWASERPYDGKYQDQKPGPQEARFE